MAHFYRIIGPRNIFLVKDVLAAEKERIEPAMAAFYQWSELDQPCRGQAVDLNLPLPGLYEYAGFFLNTLGGQSYLFRREPSLRLLIKYYAVLILDRANMADMNGHGIDIRLPLDSLLAEMEATTLLAGKEDYLQRLVELQARYQLY